jgi:hypothetical protein
MYPISKTDIDSKLISSRHFKRFIPLALGPVSTHLFFTFADILGRVNPALKAMLLPKFKFFNVVPGRARLGAIWVILDVKVLDFEILVDVKADVDGRVLTGVETVLRRKGPGLIAQLLARVQVVLVLRRSGPHIILLLGSAFKLIHF